MATRIVFLNGQETLVTETEGMARDINGPITGEQFITVLAQAALERPRRCPPALVEPTAGPIR
jgi:hypothetical protein